MKVEKVFISTYRYDFHLAKITIASIRYWYPDIPIYLIKDDNSGSFDTSDAESAWNVDVLNVERKRFGWGYGKLEPLFLPGKFSFFVIDADAVITGPVFNIANGSNADFIVDDEVQPEMRFNEIYYRLDRIRELDPAFEYPNYSFNTGQWFGTSSLLTRDDFSTTLNWSQPPQTKNKEIIFNNDQSHLNFVLHKKHGRIAVERKKLMIWPVNSAAGFIDINKIKDRQPAYPYVIHWAGMSATKFANLPRLDILRFYEQFYYSRFGSVSRLSAKMKDAYLQKEKSIRFRLKQFT